jgi:hypothetical protein
VFVSITFACKSKINPEAERIVKEWTGKIVIFPNDVKCIYPIETDTIEYAIKDDSVGRYKILFYVDSTGCTGCNLHLNI